jgi:hypothetical protein
MDKEINNLKNLCTSYFRVSKDDKWHWVKSCPDFPKAPDMQTMVCNRYPDTETICLECLAIEMRKFKQDILPSNNYVTED